MLAKYLIRPGFGEGSRAGTETVTERTGYGTEILCQYVEPKPKRLKSKRFQSLLEWTFALINTYLHLYLIDCNCRLSLAAFSEALA